MAVTSFGDLALSHRVMEINGTMEKLADWFLYEGNTGT